MSEDGKALSGWKGEQLLTESLFRTQDAKLHSFDRASLHILFGTHLRKQSFSLQGSRIDTMPIGRAGFWEVNFVALSKSKMSEGSNHRTRDRDGKYIRKTADSDISRLTSQVFIGEDGQLQRLRSPDQNRKKSIARREDTKVKEKESEACLPDHGRRRSTKGYCPFRFTLSAPITKCPEVVLPTEFHPKAIHVEDVFIQTNHATFRDSFCGQQVRFFSPIRL